MSAYSPAPRWTGQVRIGDAERDQAVSALAEHFVAGRLTQEEFDERSDQATRARYADDLQPLFADLPDPATPARRRGQRGPVPPVGWLAPALMMGMVVSGMVAIAVMLTAPWILWLLFGLFLFNGPWRRRRRAHWQNNWQNHRQVHWQHCGRR